MTAADTHRAIEAVFRIEQAKLIAGLARIVRDVGVAEELVSTARGISPVWGLQFSPLGGGGDQPVE
jgi:hypothetical protein